MRLDKFLANSGIGTRKEVKELLKKRLIKVNDEIVKDGKIHVNENEDTIKYKDEIISYIKFVYIMLNKPNDKVHKTVIDLLGDEYRTFEVFPVGRLDIDTEGLLLLTNDGVLSHNLLSPNKHVDKKYYVELEKLLTKMDIDKLEKGVELKDFTAKDAKVEIIENGEESDKIRVYITISEGKFHQVKRMFKAVGNEVKYLKRLKMGTLSLDENLKLGEYRELTEDELTKLKENF